LPVATVAILARAADHGLSHSRISVRGMSAPEVTLTNDVFVRSVLIMIVGVPINLRRSGYEKLRS
jgi:hypothetical protein